jgi:hypothetical protein
MSGSSPFCLNALVALCFVPPMRFCRTKNTEQERDIEMDDSENLDLIALPYFYYYYKLFVSRSLRLHAVIVRVASLHHAIS